MSIEISLADIISAVGLWPLLLLVALGWGIAPTVVIRLASKLYSREDPRRKEMIAEMYAVPRRERPLWALEEATRAVWDGVPERLRILRGGVRTGAFVVASSSFAPPPFLLGKFGEEALAPAEDQVIVWLGDPSDRTSTPLVLVRSNGDRPGLSLKSLDKYYVPYEVRGSDLLVYWRGQRIVLDLGDTPLRDRLLAGQPVYGRWGHTRRANPSAVDIERGERAVAAWSPDPYLHHRLALKPATQRPLRSARMTGVGRMRRAFNHLPLS